MSDSPHPRPGLSGPHTMAAAASDRAPDREYDWTRYALLSGVVGAAVVAIVFLAVDLASGRPAFFTPAVLGSALFLGESIGGNVEVVPSDRVAVVLGYTMVHGVTFVGFGALAASERLTRRKAGRFGVGHACAIAALLFVALEITFAALGWLVGSDLDLAARLGSGWIATANGLAALAMTAIVARGAQRLSDRPDAEEPE